MSVGILKKSAALALVLFALAPAVSQAGVVFSDDFQADPFGVPTTTLSQWTVDVGNVDVIGSPPPTYDFYPGHGHYLDLIGDSNPTSTISTKTTFAGGQQYLVEFDYAKNLNDSSSETDTTVASLGGTSLAITLTNPPTNFLHASFTVFAAAGSKLVFVSTTTNSDNGGILLDNVKVSAVPEPATLAMSGMAALTVTGLVLRRRKARVQA